MLNKKVDALVHITILKLVSVSLFILFLKRN